MNRTAERTDTGFELITDEQLNREKFDGELARALEDERARVRRLELALMQSDTIARVLTNVLFLILIIAFLAFISRPVLSASK